MDVGGKRAAKRESVGTGLLLNDAPGRRLSALHGDEALDQFRPFDARVGFDHATLGVEMDDPPHGSHIEKNGVAGELLAAHRVSSACHAYRLAFCARRREGRP